LMELEKLFLKKEELPILHHSCFEIPIHPYLLNPVITISRALPHLIFSKVADDWYQELMKLAENEKEEDKKWMKEVFLKTPPKVIERFGHQEIEGLSWEDMVSYKENGLVTGFSISRNSGGTLYFNRGDINCEDVIPGKMMAFSGEKAREFESRRVEDYSLALIYSQHNVDSLPGALFLRNWAITYMNEVFSHVFADKE
ncbi:MAG TPA: hypothetical protein VMC07_00355, partial [Candidatus Omnitrophota bacterium]|nr:hypothetical protein [Candidatus Omnitrophota bacterium]